MPPFAGKSRPMSHNPPSAFLIWYRQKYCSQTEKSTPAPFSHASFPFLPAVGKSRFRQDTTDYFKRYLRISVIPATPAVYREAEYQCHPTCLAIETIHRMVILFPFSGRTPAPQGKCTRQKNFGQPENSVAPTDPVFFFQKNGRLHVRFLWCVCRKAQKERFRPKRTSISLV